MKNEKIIASNSEKRKNNSIEIRILHNNFQLHLEIIYQSYYTFRYYVSKLTPRQSHYESFALKSTVN